MRKAFEWTLQALESGQSRRSILLRSKALGRGSSAVKDAFKLLDRLTKFDNTAFACQSAILGVDEVGRGPLAGPLVAACVQLPKPPPPLPFLRDSKKLLARERQVLAAHIKSRAIQFAIGVVEAHEFGGDLNLHYLTFEAMSRALSQMNTESLPCAVLVDGKFPLPSWLGPQQAVIKGDDRSLSIAAASVLAKVYRDQRMEEMHDLYPQYGFAQHVGYGTESHRQAIFEHGPCPQHRVNFLAKILNYSTQDTGSS